MLQSHMEFRYTVIAVENMEKKEEEEEEKMRTT
jgi:hypothetical protein